MKILHLFLALVFFAFALVQYNDPDPVRWMLMYGYVSAICAFAAFRRWNRVAILAGVGVALVWAVLLIPDFMQWVRDGMPSIAASMKAESPHIELMREFSGLLLCFAVLIFQYIQGRKHAFGST